MRGNGRYGLNADSASLLTLTNLTSQNNTSSGIGQGNATVIASGLTLENTGYGYFLSGGLAVIYNAAIRGNAVGVYAQSGDISVDTATLQDNVTNIYAVNGNPQIQDSTFICRNTDQPSHINLNTLLSGDDFSQCAVPYLTVFGGTLPGPRTDPWLKFVQLFECLSSSS